jgi:nitroreductase
MDKENVFTSKVDVGYRENASEVSYEEFKKVIEGRRSVRVFKDEAVPDEVIKNAIEDGLKAPNSSNLQPWTFLWVKSEEKKKVLAKLCFSQRGAKTAQHMIVCVAQTNTWKRNCQKNIETLRDLGQPVPKVVESYYKKIAPMAYGLMGPFGLFSPFKWILFNTLGLFRVMARGPIWPSDLITWAVKTTALACENIMLSCRAQGYDSLPMEGFDSRRVKKLFKLGRHDHLVMVIGVGKRAEDGVYGPQIRFPKEESIQSF